MTVPSHEPTPSARSELGRAVRAAMAADRATLPRVRGLDDAVLARWYARRIGAAWVQELRAEHVDTDVVPWSAGDGGLLYLADALPDEWAAELDREVAAGGLRTLTVAGDAVDADGDFVARVQELDALHAVASDPDLDELRRSLLSHCRSAAPVHLTGPYGTDAGDLARWAHAVLDDRPLSLLRDGSSRPGEWLLVEDIEELDGADRQTLEDRLRAPVAVSPGRRARPRPRPRHRALRTIVGQSGQLVEVLERLLVLAPTRLPVLVVGEPGAGKEALARAVHDASGRKGPFVALDMGALPEGLAEAELFGHRRGAFTGADRARVGAFRTADGGTLFLDEIGNVSPALQAKLLRVLQQGVVRPLGEDASVTVNVRVVAATNADLDALVRRGEFRRDLLGRLDGATLRLPPLRERLDDLDALARHLLKHGGDGAWCTPAALEALRGHAWPGNVRELANVLAFASAVAAGGLIDAEHLGALAPRNRRATPVLVTSSTPPGDEEGAWGLERGVVRRLTATTLRIPALQDRSAASLRGRVLAGLPGRPVAGEAMRALCARPWWGNLPELDGVLAALRALPPGPITLSLLQSHLPHLTSPFAATPIRTLLSPSRAGDRIDGLTQDFGAASVLVGRVRSMDELRRAARRDARAAGWLAAIEAAGAEPACLDLGLLRRLSRAQLLVTRGTGGLEVHALPGVARPVRAGPLVPGATLQPVSVAQPVVVGDAGEVQVVDARGRPYLQLFVFAGAVAYDDRAPEAVARSESTRDEHQATAMETRHEAPRAAPRPTTPGRVWPVTKGEEAELVRLFMGFRGGSLKAHMDRAIAARGGGGDLTRLDAYIQAAPRLSQYLARLVEFAPNEGLRDALSAALAAAPDGDLRVALWPKGVRRVLGR